MRSSLRAGMYGRLAHRILCGQSGGTMLSFLGEIEATGFSTWIRESSAIYAFPGILVVHTVGMALAAGSAAAIGLRLLGVAQQIPLNSLHALVRVAWIGFALNIVSGVLLLIAYPTKALTNPIFYLKLLAIAATIVVIRRRQFPVALLLLTAAMIVTGRLLPYTYRHMMAGH
jgi:hypothetical protein